MLSELLFVTQQFGRKLPHRPKFTRKLQCFYSLHVKDGKVIIILLHDYRTAMLLSHCGGCHMVLSADAQTDLG